MTQRFIQLQAHSQNGQMLQVRAMDQLLSWHYLWLNKKETNIFLMYMQIHVYLSIGRVGSKFLNLCPIPIALCCNKNIDRVTYSFIYFNLNHVWKFDTCECHGPSLFILYKSTRTVGKSVYRSNWSITIKLYPHKQVNLWLPIKNIPLRIKNNFTALSNYLIRKAVW